MPNEMDELLDVVDDDDILIRRETRPIVHAQGLQHRGVHVFLFDHTGKLLVQQRSHLKDTSPLALDCSVSEHLRAGERYRQGAVRGLAEELGLAGIRIRPLVKFSMNYGPNDNEICQLYEGRVDPSLVKIDPLEVEAILYSDLDELEANLRRGQGRASRWFIQLLAWYRGKPSDMHILRTYKTTVLSSQ
jgi:isopentenyl-diphosphate delta-isomerase